MCTWVNVSCEPEKNMYSVGGWILVYRCPLSSVIDAVVKFNYVFADFMSAGSDISDKRGFEVASYNNEFIYFSL